jgi:hypothetical protein
MRALPSGRILFLAIGTLAKPRAERQGILSAAPRKSCMRPHQKSAQSIWNDFLEDLLVESLMKRAPDRHPASGGKSLRNLEW